MQDSELLPTAQREAIRNSETSGLLVSAIFVWEIAKGVELGRIALPQEIDEWTRQALAYPGVALVPISPQIAIESTQLPGSFHKDPADQIIVATARILTVPLLTLDRLILEYDGVQTL